jgi:hypothetical protein
LQSPLAAIADELYHIKKSEIAARSHLAQSFLLTVDMPKLLMPPQRANADA